MKLSDKKSLLAGAALLLLGIVLVNVGLANNENAVVLQKAIKICLECIGIG